MTGRVVAVLASPGRLAPELSRAMLEDVIDLVTTTPQVTIALAVPAGADQAARELVWPNTPVIDVPDAAPIATVLGALQTDDVTAAAVVAPDVPDLPGLLLGKLFSAIAGVRSPAVAVCPATDAGLVAAAARLPLPEWLLDTGVTLDDADGLDRLSAAAPRGGLNVGPGWHRIRNSEDLRQLDPGLDGWEATRAHLNR